MVRHHRKVIETAARYGIMVDVHEPITTPASGAPGPT
jgi:hypothetical protein